MNADQSDTNQNTVDPQPPDRVLPAAEGFLSDGGAPSSVEGRHDEITTVPQRVAPCRPGPGLFESIAWMIGMFVVQSSAFVLTTVLVFGVVLTTDSDLARTGLTDLVNRIAALLRNDLLVILGVSQLATIAYGWLAIRIRIRPGGLRRLGWQFPSKVHWLFVVLLMPPMWLLSSALQNALFRWMPWTESSMRDLVDAFAQAPLWLGMLVIGVGPAIAEELVFRGLIGRGLVARWGLAPGMLVTSILFGAMHVNPAQALAVVPLGLAMHFVYFTTRSFWAPMIFHLFNNSLSVICVKYLADTQVDRLLETDAELPIPMVFASLAMVTGIGLVLWQTRMQYRLRDGSVWNPGYISSEAPPAEVDAVAVRHRACPLVLAGSACSTLGFVVTLWLFATH
jgi:membrane protease YdiL (CAAX protease family)